MPESHPSPTINDSYWVRRFAPAEFEKLINEIRERIKLAPLTRDTHLDYLARYLETVETATLVVELEYIDQHYLEDFAGYYVRCFKEYRRFCVRIHAFSNPFSLEKFTGMLSIRHLVEDNETDNGQFRTRLKDSYITKSAFHFLKYSKHAVT